MLRWLLFEKFFNKSSQKLLRDQEQKKLEKEKLEQEKAAAQAAENAESEKPKSARGAKSGGGRNPLPTDLPRVEKTIDHEVPKCDFCGKEFKCIGEERSEQLHFKPMGSVPLHRRWCCHTAGVNSLPLGAGVNERKATNGSDGVISVR